MTVWGATATHPLHPQSLTFGEFATTRANSLNAHSQHQAPLAFGAARRPICFQATIGAGCSTSVEQVAAASLARVEQQPVLLEKPPARDTQMTSGQNVEVVVEGNQWPHPDGEGGWRAYLVERRRDFESPLAGVSYSNGVVARAWQRTSSRADYTAAELSAEYPQHTLKGIVSPWLAEPAKQLPLFTAFAEKRQPVVPLFEDELMMALINAQTPFVEDYPPGRGESAASGSLFHILAIPHCRCYNVVSLDGTIDAGASKKPIPTEEYLTQLRERCTAYIQKNIGKVIERARDEARVKVQGLYGKTEGPDDVQRRIDACLDRMQAMWEGFLATGEKLSLGFFFHAHDDHTIGHMHTHVFPLNASLRTNLVHDPKCIPLHEVIEVVRASPPAAEA